MTATSTVSDKTAAASLNSFRPELQGLRALAVGLVLLFHLWPGRVSGGFVGVDVFFVISGFLITGHLYRELSSTGTIKVTKFWARRVMRLLPLAFAVLVFSFLALIFFLPETTWGMNLRQILASLFYIENWILAADSVDYMAAENEPSLVQHYWSLSIEEQFYFVLPLLMLAAFSLVKILPRRQARQAGARSIMAWTLGLVGIASFIFSVLYTSYDPAQAYFITPTRMWEFSIGGLMALIATSSTLEDRLQNMLSWAGIGMILVAALMYSGGTAFPGYTALLPVIGTALFIRFGSFRQGSGAYWWASRTPCIKMGDWSYAIYLWHWPLIIIATYLLEDFSWPDKLGLIALTFMLSMASQRFIEDPLRKAPYFKVPRRAFSAMAASIAVVFAGTTILSTIYASEDTERISISDCTGANALLRACSDLGLEGDPLVPPAQVAQEKSERPYPECFIPQGKTDFDRSDCSLGADPETADLTIAMLGSSHARMWLPMLDEVGKQHNWNIQGYTKSACSPVPLSKTSPEDAGAEREDNLACDEFVVDSAQEIADDPEIDVVATASLGAGGTFRKSNGEVASHDEKVAAIDAMWQQWVDADKSVVSFAEVPHFGDIEAPTCVESNGAAVAEECSISYEEGVASRGHYQKMTAKEGETEVALYDPTKGMCDGQRCYSVVGDLITRYDHHHLSEDFVVSYSADFTNFMHDEVLSD